MTPTPTMREDLEQLAERWRVYRQQLPRNLNGEPLDQKVVDQENTLMDVFLQDLDRILRTSR